MAVLCRRIMPRKIEKAEPLGSIPTSARKSKLGDSLFTPQEAADFLRVSLSWLAKARMRGDGPPFAKFGRVIRYPENGLIAYTKSRMRLSTSE